MLPVTVGADPMIRAGQVIGFVCGLLILCDARHAQDTLGERLPRFLRRECFPGQFLPDQLRVLLQRPTKEQGEIPVARLADPLLPAGLFVTGAVSAVLFPQEWADAGKAKGTMLMIPFFSVRPIRADITEFYVVHIVPRNCLQPPVVFKKFFI